MMKEAELCAEEEKTVKEGLTLRMDFLTVQLETQHFQTSENIVLMMNR